MACCDVKYDVQCFDGPRTMEQQTLLLAIAVKRAWEAWSRPGNSNFPDAGPTVLGVNANLDDAMRRLYQQLQETDVFMSGVQHGRKE